MDLKWIKYGDLKPIKGQRVFISDGNKIALAIYTGPETWELFDGCGFGGFEWEWDLNHEISEWYWADASNFNLPEEAEKKRRS